MPEYLVATDLDGTFGPPRNPSPTLCISGRTWPEYNERAKDVAKIMPVYIRGTGAYGDREDAGVFKAKMIALLGVTHYWEDDPVQALIITTMCPGVTVLKA